MPGGDADRGCLAGCGSSHQHYRAKDAPIARKTLAAFRNRYSKPPGAAQKPLWQYIDSLFALCDRLKNEAEARLPRARSLESEGKKADALREYRAINQIYPNKVTA